MTNNNKTIGIKWYESSQSPYLTMTAQFKQLSEGFFLYPLKVTAFGFFHASLHTTCEREYY